MSPVQVSSAARRRTRHFTKPSTDDAGTPVQSLASLLIRSLLVLFLLLTSLLLALIAWFSLKTFLRVDPILGRERVWLQYGEFRTPYALVELPQGRYGAPGENYDMSLELRVPSSEQNLVMGNFMVSISLLNSDNESILNNSRPAILTHHPTLPSSKLSNFLVPFRSIPPPAQSIHLPLLESVALNRNSWQGRKRTERIYLEVGRKDAHPEWNPQFEAQVGAYSGGGNGRAMAATTRIGGELQVYESWLRIEVRLYGLRSLIRSHPYVSFLFFFPTFLLTELLAALAVYAYFVLRPEESSDHIKEELEGSRPIKVEPKEMEGESDNGIEKVLDREIPNETAESEDDNEQAVKDEELTTSEPPSGRTETETEEDDDAKWQAERRKARREREAGPGGKMMSEIAGDSGTDEVTESETGVSEVEQEEGEGSEEWAAIEREPGAEKDFDETATIGGSETTRASRSTFGPSVAGTDSTRTTATSTDPSRRELRERQGHAQREE